MSESQQKVVGCCGSSKGETMSSVWMCQNMVSESCVPLGGLAGMVGRQPDSLIVPMG